MSFAPRHPRPDTAAPHACRDRGAVRRRRRVHRQADQAGRVDLATAQSQLKGPRAGGALRRRGDTLRRYIGPYQQLERAGIIGEEKRLNWIDALRMANSDAQLYGVDYEVGSRCRTALPKR